jgi:hypothetical protein
MSLVSSSETSPTPMLLNGSAPEEKPCECDSAANGESLRTIGRIDGCLPSLPLPYAWSGVGERAAIVLREGTKIGQPKSVMFVGANAENCRYLSI